MTSDKKELMATKITDLSPMLREKAGLFATLKAERGAKKAAGQALEVVEREKVRVEKEVALTALAMVEGAMKQRLVGEGMILFGSLTNQVNAATATVDQALSNGRAAETIIHMDNRDQNIQLANSLHHHNKITEQERDVLIALSEADATLDIQRSRERMLKAKEVVSKLHEFATTNIGNGIDKIR